MNTSIKEVCLFGFIYYIVIYRDIHKILAHLEKTHQTMNFKISIPFSKRKILFFQDRAMVAKVLQKKSRLPFVNHNFNVSHGHFRSINAVNTTDSLWKDLHFELLGIFNQTKISPIMEKYKHILIGDLKYRPEEALEEYFLKVWSEYSFGPIDDREYAKVRKQLIDNVTLTFHGNPVNRLPWIGWITSKLNYLRYRTNIERVDSGLSEFLKSAIHRKQGAFYQLYEKLQPKYPDAFQIALDNAFLGVLAYDFIYIVLLDFVVNLAKSPDKDRKTQLQKSIHQGFLYPFRFRKMDESFDEVNKDDFCVINLQKAGLYFSYGPRFCSGANLFKEISNKLIELLSPYELQLVRPEDEIVYGQNQDIPTMTSRHEIRICPFRPKTAFENA
jgi:hypothetical protein